VELDPRCVMCNRHDEDGAHLFFKCKYVKYIWTTLGLDHQRSILSDMLTPEVVVKYILNLKEELQPCIVTLLLLRPFVNGKLFSTKKKKRMPPL